LAWFIDMQARVRILLGIVAMVAMVAAAMPVSAGSDDSAYSIMRPEPGTPGVAPSYRSPRRTPQQVKPLPKAKSPRQRSYTVPPPIVMPETGRVVPSVPIVPRGAVPGGGAESFGDRAARCAHQGGLAGLPNDQQNSYMGTCLNQ
jgi:hypothetical protein